MTCPTAAAALTCHHLRRPPPTTTDSCPLLLLLPLCCPYCHYYCPCYCAHCAYRAHSLPGSTSCTAPIAGWVRAPTTRPSACACCPSPTRCCALRSGGYGWTRSASPTYMQGPPRCLCARLHTPTSLRYLRTCIPTCLALGYFACSIASCLLLTHRLLLTYSRTPLAYSRTPLAY